MSFTNRSNSSKMDKPTFDKHLENIVKAISVEDKMRDYLLKDFKIIRVYLIDLLKDDPIIGPMIIETLYPASNFNCSVTLDLSRYTKLGVEKTHYPSFLKLTHRGRGLLNGMQDLPIFRNGENIAGGIITNIVKNLIDQGLNICGYFVRGHMGDIYELELNPETKHIEHSYAAYDGEWQDNYIIVKAISEERIMNIRLRVLLKFCHNETPNDILPHPTHNLKMVWLLAADVRYSEYFSLCAPLTERELASSLNNLMAMRLLFALVACNKMQTIKKNHLESVTYEIMYTKSPKGPAKTRKESVVDNIIWSLRRMIYFFDTSRFPFFWNIKENLLALIRNQGSRLYTRSLLHILLDQIYNMRRDAEVAYEEVESFFGLHSNSHIYNVDDFGIYRAFAELS
ncbi:uncharacterized protein LOC101451621 isoform X1 [Ceratitis capitata]|uniref:uncharacterized protein LOC101451621 isoform X1 n=2 Tax=Ceratitis capitata TaxID=7213 RepID=UPI00032A24D8|nr:uncharacterized protein LOC101451621 isoform X1 [Ceratitis capitata]